MPSSLNDVLIIALLAGLAMPLGALISTIHGIQPRWLAKELRHGILALGAGALVSAVALVLVPQGLEGLPTFAGIGCFIAGAIGFMGLDIFFARSKSKASQLAAMLTDFIPESLALGAAAATGGSTLLLGGLIGLQNLPEGFNAFREMAPNTKRKKVRLLLIFTAMALLGPLMTLIGFWVLDDYPVLLSSIMLFAGGGILYSVFQDIAPQVPMRKHWLPTLGAILGFALGMVGFLLEGH
ncbi:divalent cation transporter [Alteromonas sp. KUL49]|uniref:ZIP family metal transporter n=1 Tax=Alteromonas sp. KUL49 TaxID=2480798 RepID=UPI00102F1704|nr:divalent cation transporter [Alteromonas sp. KUL49]TAP39037.1 divalent cation transporter [Alteromonas sp. KUL49]GEA12491.1 divalent cation transporter [Alteromonas sp. KUL49]